jgi:hypothetical protein
VCVRAFALQAAGGAAGLQVYDGSLKAPQVLAFLQSFAPGGSGSGNASGSGGSSSVGSKPSGAVAQFDVMSSFGDLAPLDKQEDMALAVVQVVGASLWL